MDILLITIVALSSWFFNEKNKPLYVAIPIQEDVVKIYEIDNKYQCPIYCGVEHIHKIHADTYKLQLDKKSKMKIYLQK